MNYKVNPLDLMQVCVLKEKRWAFQNSKILKHGIFAGILLEFATGWLINFLVEFSPSRAHSTDQISANQSKILWYSVSHLKGWHNFNQTWTSAGLRMSNTIVWTLLHPNNSDWSEVNSNSNLTSEEPRSSESGFRNLITVQLMQISNSRHSRRIL